MHLSLHAQIHNFMTKILHFIQIASADRTLVTANTVAFETTDSQSHVQPEHKESSDMTKVDTAKLNCKEEKPVEVDAKLVEQKTQEPVVLVPQRKKRKLKTFPKFPKTKKSILVVPTFVEDGQP